MPKRAVGKKVEKKEEAGSKVRCPHCRPGKNVELRLSAGRRDRYRCLDCDAPFRVPRVA